jgi:hypothetical protein
MTRAYPKSLPGYINALKLRFEDKDANDEAYAKLEKVRYEGCICDMFTQIQTFNDKAMITGPALRKLILERLPHKILDQMHTVDQAGKSNHEIISIISNDGKTAEKCEAARKNLGPKDSLRSYDKKCSKFGRNRNQSGRPRFERRKEKKEYRSDRKKFKQDRSERKGKKDYSKTAGIEPSEIERRKAAGECYRCAWPADR